ncbi:MAG TPA: hypothetical protein VMW04_00775 [Patescibacteria group bacterium]|nr:hypothetical protein [Patescibacteria group bacterium]
MAENQGGGRPFWQWILIALIILGIIYLVFSLFALGRNQQPGTTPTPTPTEEISPMAEEATPTLAEEGLTGLPSPTRPITTTLSPSPFQETPQTGF